MAYFLLNAVSYDGEIWYADAYRPCAGHVLVFMSIGVVVTKIMTFFPKMRSDKGLEFCCRDLRSVGVTAGLYQPAGWLAAAEACRNLIGPARPCVFNHKLIDR